MTLSAVLMGTGTSTGVPVIGKVYPPEYLADPRNHRTRCALLLKGPRGNVLVDAGPDIRLQLLKHQVMAIEACLITHTHADHIMGLDDLRSFSQHSGVAVRLVTSKRYQEDIKRVFPYAFMEFPPGIMVPRFELEEPGDALEIAGIPLEIMWVEHGPHPVMALRVGGFAYVTDVSRIPEAAWQRLQGLDVLVLDAVRIQPHPNHLHLDAALEVAQQLGAKKTYLTHLSDDFDHGPDEARLPAGVFFAYDGLELPVETGNLTR